MTLAFLKKHWFCQRPLTNLHWTLKCLWGDMRTRRKPSVELPVNRHSQKGKVMGPRARTSECFQLACFLRVPKSSGRGLKETVRNSRLSGCSTYPTGGLTGRCLGWKWCPHSPIAASSAFFSRWSPPVHKVPLRPGCLELFFLTFFCFLPHIPSDICLPRCTLGWGPLFIRKCRQIILYGENFKSTLCHITNLLRRTHLSPLCVFTP